MQTLSIQNNIFFTSVQMNDVKRSDQTMRQQISDFLTVVVLTQSPLLSKTKTRPIQEHQKWS